MDSPRRCNNNVIQIDNDVDSQDTPLVYEEKWNEEVEKLLCSWKEEAREQGRSHGNAGSTLRFKHNLLNFIVILWASINLVSSNFFECNNETVTTLISLVINSVQVFLNGLNSSLNLGYAYRVHYDFETKYEEMALDIETELGKGRAFRRPSDAFTVAMKERKKRLSEAPPIPTSRCFIC